MSVPSVHVQPVPESAVAVKPVGSVSVTVTEEPDTLVYRFVMSSTDTLAPGTYTFIAKYADPADSRDVGADTYEATATSASGAPLRLSGDFS